MNILQIVAVVDLESVAGGSANNVNFVTWRLALGTATKKIWGAQRATTLPPKATRHTATGHSPNSAFIRAYPIGDSAQVV